MDDNMVNWLAGSVVALWAFGAMVYPLARRDPRYQAFNQNLLRSQTQQSALVLKQPVKRPVARRLRYY